MELPWKPRSPQEKGRKAEKPILKERGARAHPGSGSGGIKWDGSNDDEVIEIKDAAKSYTLAAKYLESLYRSSTRQSKAAVLIVQFPTLLVECRITRRTDQ